MTNILKIKDLDLVCSKAEMSQIPDGKYLINTINAFSFNNARKDKVFRDSLTKCDYLLPDGASIVKACNWLNTKTQPLERIAGYDLFEFEMNKLCSKFMNNKSNSKPTVMFMGSSEKVLSLIKEKTAVTYPCLNVETYSPPYRDEFSKEENNDIINTINRVNPDLLWIGMTAPKQEKWAYTHWDELKIHCHVGTIGAVFDFFAGTAVRAPQSWQDRSLEWLHRLIKEPKRMWRRYLIGNTEFLWYILCEKYGF